MTQETDPKLTVGMRDAVHVPFVVVQCATIIRPGEKLSLRHDDMCVRWGGKPEQGEDYAVEPKWHGVADPFLESDIAPGVPFRVFIRKECFSGLTHRFRIETDDRGGTATCHNVCNIE